jgi:hypothetical protein
MESIEKRNPKEPDILCKIENEGMVAFELVRLIPKEDANRMALWESTRAMVKKYHESLEADKRKRFDKKYSDAFICFYYGDGVSVQKRRASLPEAFKFLLGLPDQSVGEFRIGQKNGLKEIWIDRYSIFTKPHFDTSNAGFVIEPTEKSISAKCKKTYQTDHPIELLAHFVSNDIFPDKIWYPLVEELFKGFSNLGMFQRIWFFDETHAKIKYVHPNNSPPNKRLEQSGSSHQPGSKRR